MQKRPLFLPCLMPLSCPMHQKRRRNVRPHDSAISHDQTRLPAPPLGRNVQKAGMPRDFAETVVPLAGRPHEIIQSRLVGTEQLHRARKFYRFRQTIKNSIDSEASPSRRDEARIGREGNLFLGQLS